MQSTKLTAFLIALAATAATVVAIGPVSESAAATTGTPLIGIHLNDSNAPGSASAWEDSVVNGELDADRRLDLISTSAYGFAAVFPTWREPFIEQNGSEPIIDWKTRPTKAVANGTNDSVLAARAEALKAFGSPVMLRFAPGMSDPAQLGTMVSPASFTAAWIHAYGIFAAHGVSNVSWVWCPTAASWADGTAMQWYPGDQYVDAVCAQGTTVTPDVSFTSEFAPFEQAASTLGKPMIIDSFGVSEGAPGEKAQWITDAYTALATTFSDMYAAVQDGTGTAAMTTSPDAESAWAAAVSQPGLYTAPVVTLPTGSLVPADGTSMLGALLTKSSPTVYQKVWDSLEATSGGNVDIAHTTYPWGTVIPTWRESSSISQGRIPMISWGAVKTTDVIAGTYDDYITSTAMAIRDLGSPVFLRWFWEMDGTNFAAKAVNPDDYKAAWAHIHAIFDSVGATNVVWVWCPTGYGFTLGLAQPFYPGDSLVDWVAADGFNSYPDVARTYPQSFASIFTTFYAWGMSIGKPMMVGATGALETSDPMAKANWITNMARAIQLLDPGIRAICYVDQPAGWYANPSLTLHWEIGTSSNATQAWSQIAEEPTFADAR